MSAPTLADLRPGDILFGPIHGFIPGVLPVGAGQIILATRKARLSWRQWWRIRHVGVVVESRTQRLSRNDGPRLVQAMPSGAEEIEMTPEQHWTAEYVYIRPRYRMAGSVAHGGMTERVAEAARSYVGTPYNFLTYGKLAASALHLPVTRRVLARWISTRHDMMCSQLADQALTDAGFHVFDDGRLPQDVVPAELFRQLLSLPGQWLCPGKTDAWIPNCLWGESIEIRKLR